jgi:uncharacterized protein (TIGR00725 family)
VKPEPLSRYTIGVIGSGTSSHDAYAHDVGVLLAELGVNLLTGGGRGVMTSVSRAFTQHPGPRGICIGIIPCASENDRVTPRAGYPNEFVELAIYTHLPHSGSQGTDDLSRNHINVLSSNAIIALPGEAGTASEVTLAISYRRPIVVYSPDVRLARELPEVVSRVGTIEDVRQFLARYLV